MAGVVAVMAVVAVVGVVGGCQQRAAEPAPIAIEDRVPPVLETHRAQMPEQRFPPAAVMPPEELTLIYRTTGAALLRVVRQDQRGEQVVMEIEAPGGSVLMIDRGEGISLGRQRQVEGPLNREATFLVYALPPGGVRQEVTRSILRPPTAEEREAVLEERREDERRRLEEQERERRERSREPADPGDVPDSSGGDG